MGEWETVSIINRFEPMRELGEVAARLALLHPKSDAFPGEVLVELAADAIEESGATRGSRNARLQGAHNVGFDPQGRTRTGHL